MNVYFSEVFNVSHDTIENYGALDISLVCDNPAFIDPFLIFAQEKYGFLHDKIIAYLIFLWELSNRTPFSSSIYKTYYKFTEVKQNWLGYSLWNNLGQGLGKKFAQSLHNNLRAISLDDNTNKITKSPHLEKICLIEDGVGVDKISDFTVNLIKDYLLDYTEKFALQYIDQKYVKKFAIQNCTFDFKEKYWKSNTYSLPFINTKGKDEYVLLSPKDILVKDDSWISKNNFLSKNATILEAIDDEELRQKINDYFLSRLGSKIVRGKKVLDNSQANKKRAILETARIYPQLLDYYIRLRESESDIALANNVKMDDVGFYDIISIIRPSLLNSVNEWPTVLSDCFSRLLFFKKVLESNSGIFHQRGRLPSEKELQLMFKMATCGAFFNYDSEVNNGRWPIDFIVSFGAEEKVGIELKLASNSKLKNNLQYQTDVYKEDSWLHSVIKVIFYFSDEEKKKLDSVLDELGIGEGKELICIDCRKKKSASNVND